MRMQRVQGSGGSRVSSLIIHLFPLNLVQTGYGREANAGLHVSNGRQDEREQTRTFGANRGSPLWACWRKVSGGRLLWLVAEQHGERLRGELYVSAGRNECGPANSRRERLSLGCCNEAGVQWAAAQRSLSACRWAGRAHDGGVARGGTVLPIRLFGALRVRTDERAFGGARRGGIGVGGR